MNAFATSIDGHSSIGLVSELLSDMKSECHPDKNLPFQDLGVRINARSRRARVNGCDPGYGQAFARLDEPGFFMQVPVVTALVSTIGAPGAVEVCTSGVAG